MCKQYTPYGTDDDIHTRGCWLIGLFTLGTRVKYGTSYGWLGLFLWVTFHKHRYEPDSNPLPADLQYTALTTVPSVSSSGEGGGALRKEREKSGSEWNVNKYDNTFWNS